MAPFDPVYRDGLSAAVLITMLAAGKPYDTILSYEEIAAQLGISPDDAVRLRSGVARAKPVLLREHQKALKAVPRKGYRIVRPGEQAGLATAHRQKSDRSIKRAIAVLRHANEDDMSDPERVRHHKVTMAVQLLHERQQDTERRVSRLEELMLGTHRPTVIPGSVEQPRAIEGPCEEEQ